MASPSSQGSLSSFVEAFRNSSHPSHAAVLKYWALSIGTNGPLLHDQKRIRHHSAGQIGSNFLKAQVSYLEQGPAKGVIVHFVCTERFAEEVAQLLGPLRPSNKVPCERHTHAHNLTQEESVLSPALERVIREDMFPWDTLLHRLVCGSRLRAVRQ